MNTDEQLLDILAPHLKPRSEIPRGYDALTVAIHLGSESAIVKSIHNTLRGTDFLVTLQAGKIEFWRPRIRKKQAYYGGRVSVM